MIGRETEAEECSRAALDDYKKMLRTRPDDPRYLSQVGSILEVIGKFPDAVDHGPGLVIPDRTSESREDSFDDESTGIADPKRADRPAPQWATDRNLKLLVLGQERGFLQRQDFAVGIQIWHSDPDVDLGEKLIAANLLSPEQRAILDAAVDRQLAAAESPMAGQLTTPATEAVAVGLNQD